MSSPGQSPEQDWDHLHESFRPRRARAVAGTIGVVVLVVLCVVAALLPSNGGEDLDFKWYDRAGVVAVGAAVAWWMSRYVLLIAQPTAEGLRVRNLVYGRTVTWAQILSVRMGNGDPWVTLEISDGDMLAVMAIQRADGAFGRAEANRLATLVAAHQRPPHTPG